jgi:hypothetical protein
MPDYNEGKIYTVRCRNDKSLIYVGSTVEKYLSSRYSKHRCDKTCSLYKYIEHNCNLDWSEWYIELHELYPCNSKMELNKREGEIQREISTINKRIENRSKKEYSQQYCKENKEHISQQHKEYREQNKEKINETMKIWYEKNRSSVLEKQKEKIECCCGCLVTKKKLKRHQISKKHNLFLENNNIIQ